MSQPQARFEAAVGPLAGGEFEIVSTGVSPQSPAHYRPARFKPIRRLQRFMAFYGEQRRHRFSRKHSFLMALMLSRRFERVVRSAP